MQTLKTANEVNGLSGTIFLTNTLDNGKFYDVRENEDGSVDYLLGVGLAKTTDGWVTLAKDLHDRVQWNDESKTGD